MTGIIKDNIDRITFPARESYCSVTAMGATDRTSRARGRGWSFRAAPDRTDLRGLSRVSPLGACLRRRLSVRTSDVWRQKSFAGGRQAPSAASPNLERKWRFVRGRSVTWCLAREAGGISFLDSRVWPKRCAEVIASSVLRGVAFRHGTRDQGQR